MRGVFETRRVVLAGIATALLLAGAGCSASHHSAARASTSTDTAAPAATSTLSSRRTATFRVENGDGMAAVAGSLWIKTDDGRVVQVDPATNKVRREIKLDTTSDPSTYCQGIGTDGASVFACATTDDGTDVVVIEPATGKVVRRIKADKTFDQLALPVTARGVWVLTGDGSSVGVIDPKTGALTTYPLGVRCQQLAAHGDRVVATSQLSDAVVVLDANSGTAVGRLQMTSPRIAAISADGRTWVDTRSGLTRLRRDLSVETVYPQVLATADGDVVSAGNAVWVRVADGSVTKIDTASGRQLERISADHPLTAGSLLIAFDSIWLTSSDDAKVERLRATA